jgi:diguanylate cyclase (GGDEF)-like protein
MTLRLLIADDDPVSRLRLQRTLAGWGYDVQVAADGLAAWELLRHQPPGQSLIAILDWQMPGLDGLGLAARIKADPDARFTYVIVLTSKSGTDDIVTAMNAGADDFVAKPFHPDELKVRVRAGARIVELQAELREQASHDELTTALTRRWVMELLDREIVRARRDAHPLAVAMVDIDLFKRVNDTHGHPACDDVIRQVSARLLGAMRGSDLLGRYGGEEFIVVLPDCDAAGAKDVANRMREAVCASPIRVGQGVALDMAVSIGFAAASPDDLAEATRDALVASADRALYRAKANGRNRVERADD